MNKHFSIGVIFVITLVTLGISAVTQQQLALSKGDSPGAIERAAPIAISGDNTYIAWWTNKTGNDEVQFRASTDGGAIFADKINLSNSTGAESQDVEIAAEGDNVVITWWERNQTSEEPVARISSDNGQTFGPVLTLATNGTLGEASEVVEEEEEE